MGRGGSASGQQQMVVDPDRPRFHVHPPQGWMNDPNGPVFYKGRYHMFYQHLPNACEWAFGIVWGHVVSEDLVHWRHLPPALVPTPGTPDADGCFSGSCVLDSDGTPVLLYTGVRLRSNLGAGPLPPPEHDLGMVWIETQMAAVPEDPDDELLVRWRKVDAPFLHLPPSDLQLTGWRDPFVFTANTAAAPNGGFTAHGYSREMRMLIGSGLKGQGGTALVYKSTSLLSGWELEGTLCEASNTDTGVVWECPLLVPLDPVPRTLRAPGKQAPPLWLICGPDGGSSSEGGSQDGEGTAFGSFDQPAGADAHKRSPTPDLPYGPLAKGSAAAPAAAAAGAAQQTAAPPPAANASSSGAEGGTAGTAAAAAAAHAAAAGSKLAAPAEALVLAALHARSDSFAFDQDPSAEDLALAAEAASAVQSWQQQASGSAAGSAATSPREQAAPVHAAATAAVATAAAAQEGPTAAQAAPAAPATAPAAAAVPPAALAVPSDAAALPPGRRRQPVADAQIDLDSAASLVHWSQPPSEQQSPESSALPSPQTSPQQPSSHHSSPQRPPLQQRRGRPPALQLPGAALPDGQRVRQRSSTRGSVERRQDAQQAQQAQQQHEEEEDRFAAAFSRLSMRGIRARKRSAEPSSRRGSQAALAALARLWGEQEEEEVARTPPPPARQWHFFTVSPDAPTNPVLYWMGHVDDSEMPRFELEAAKGPYRLDLGDVLYAPNVCQDGQGRWLMWGWLQERRKVGSYSYAGCLTLPRVLHCTEDGRLVQAPIPELVQLRQGPGWHQQLLHVPAESTVPLPAAPGAAALDIELTLDRGSAFAAGLLFRSHEAEAEGGTALIYDWERNALEAIFNVPPNWQPPAQPHTAKFSGSGAEGSEAFDPALLLTPRPSELMLGRESSRTPSALFSPDAGFGFDSQTASAAASPRTATESLAGDASSALLSPQRSGITIAGATPRPPPLDLGIPGLPLPPHLAEEAAGQGGGMLAAAGLGAAAFSSSLPRSLGGLGGGGAGSLPTGGLYRSVSDVRLAAGGMTRVGSHPALQSYGSSLPRLGGTGMPASPGGRSPRLPQPPGVDTDADLDFLLDELAAPMREAPPPIVEPRRVGGPLPSMRANAPLHLRILVDHSCVEVYTGTGETLSTRIYRGQMPEGATDAGIALLAFGGTALVRSVSCYEMASAWEHPAVAAAVSPKLAAKVAPSPRQAGVLAAAAAAAAAGSRGSSAAASPAAKAANSAVRLEPAGAEEEPGLPRGASPAAATAAAAAADALLDEMVMLSPQCSAAVVGAFS